MFDAVVHPHLLHPEWIPRYERWYCLHCIDASKNGDGWTTDTGCSAHISQAHGVDRAACEEGVDYASGEWIKVLLNRWHNANGELIRRAELQVSSLIGLDDFLFECGG